MLCAGALSRRNKPAGISCYLAYIETDERFLRAPNVNAALSSAERPRSSAAAWRDLGASTGTDEGHAARARGGKVGQTARGQAGERGQVGGREACSTGGHPFHSLFGTTGPRSTAFTKLPLHRSLEPSLNDAYVEASQLGPTQLDSSNL